MVARYGLIGYPLGHSFSEKYFSEKFAREVICASYKLFPLKAIEELPELLASIPELRGLNVTIPYKRAVIPYLDFIDEKASKIGAVNVIKIEYKKGRRVLVGYNSDSPAFADTLNSLDLQNIRRGLILGTGGASDAISSALSDLKIEWTKVSRNPDGSQLSYQELTPEIVSSFRLVVNTTPVGMYPSVEDVVPFPFKYLSNNHICYDLIYNPGITSFIREAANQGAWIKNGLEMLHRQAEIAWNIWNS